MHPRRKNGGGYKSTLQICVLFILFVSAVRVCTERKKKNAYNRSNKKRKYEKGKEKDE